MGVVSKVCAVALVLVCVGCAEQGGAPREAGAEAGVDASAPEAGVPEAGLDAGDAAPLQASVELGLPAGEDGLGFRPLEPGAELRLQTFGQGGTHLTLGVRTRGFGNRAFVSITLRNRETGAEAVSPAPVRPQLLWCQDDGNCDLVPLLAMTAGLVAHDAEREGVEVEVEATVRDDESDLERTVSQWGVLSTKDL